MKFNLIGNIKTVKKRIFIDKKECHGITIADKNTFSIKISEKACTDPVVFIETVLHELCHVWLYIVMALGRRHISEPQAERIILKITNNALLALRAEIKNDD